MNNKEIYEIEFEELVPEENNYELIDNKKALLKSRLDINVTVGSTTKSISDIVNLKEGDIINLNKNTEDLLEFKVNGKEVAKGEIVSTDNKVAIRILKI